MDRAQTLRELKSTRFDVLILGGGATGLGIAVDAASRGFRTALVEAGDFAQATSSRATKLVHGGVRYLVSGQIHLVYEALHERRIMLRNAPHLVHALPLVTPAYKWFDLPFYGSGLKAYDVLSGSASMGATRMLTRQEVLDRIPGIQPRKLKGGILYFDGQFDDARLAIALALTAEDHGAVVANYVRCTGLLKSEGLITGAHVTDVESGNEMDVCAGLVINATGIFSDEVRQQDRPDLPNLLSTSRGTHILVPQQVLGAQTAIMVPKTADGRLIFAIPWQGRCLIGTTDVPQSTVCMEPGHSAAEIEFLLSTLNPYLSKPICTEDILSVFSGLRPLVTGKVVNTSRLSREHFLDISPSGLITIAGGKWTTYRRMAEDTLSFAVRHGRLPARPCITRTLPLHGAPAHAEDLHATTPASLVQYGTDAAQVLAIAANTPSLAASLHPELPLTGSEVLFAVRNEKARTVEDVLSRRSRSLLLNSRAAVEAAPAAAALMADELQQDQDWCTRQVSHMATLARNFYCSDAAV